MAQTVKLHTACWISENRNSGIYIKLLQYSSLTKQPCQSILQHIWGCSGPLRTSHTRVRTHLLDHMPPCEPLLALQWNLHVDHLHCHQFLSILFYFFFILLLSFTVSTSPSASITLISFLTKIFVYRFIFL